MPFSKIYTSQSPNWVQKDTILYDELIVSWNGARPISGKWTFWVSVYEGEWLKIAEWGADGQRTFRCHNKHSRSYQDVAIPDRLQKGFHVRVEGDGLEGLKQLTVCLSNLGKFRSIRPRNLDPVILKGVVPQSQMVLNHPRHRDLCSPTATAIATNYILGNSKLDPEIFAEKCRDETFDIYGNWILNIAESYSMTSVLSHIERMNSFRDLHRFLKIGLPVVVSVKGPLKGAPKPYQNGHLMCVIGYKEERVYCVDPGFDDNASCASSYCFNDFLEAWGRRKNLSYVFRKPTQTVSYSVSTRDNW